MLSVSQRIFCPLLNEIKELASQSARSNSFFYPTWDLHKFDVELSQTRVAVEKWLSPLNLGDFNFFNIEDGVTGALNKWIAEEQRPIQMFKGDYKWIAAFKKDIHFINDYSEINPNAVLYISNPSSTNGDYLIHWKDIIATGAPIVLDCVYMGAAKITAIDISPNIEKMFFSLSKNFALPRARAGFSFSRTFPIEYKIMRDHGYYSYLTTELIKTLSSAVPFDYSFHKLRNLQTAICDDLKIKPSDTVFLAQLPKSDPNSFLERTRYCITPELTKRHQDLFFSV